MEGRAPEVLALHLLLRVRASDKQHSCQLGACWKYRILDPTPGLLNLNMDFNKIGQM